MIFFGNSSLVIMKGSGCEIHNRHLQFLFMVHGKFKLLLLNVLNLVERTIVILFYMIKKDRKEKLFIILFPVKCNFSTYENKLHISIRCNASVKRVANFYSRIKLPLSKKYF